MIYGSRKYKGLPAVLMIFLLFSCVPKGDQESKIYRNPVLSADFSDPDVISYGKGFYMVASSFNCVPGLPVLYSPDLVNWTILTYALPALYPEDNLTGIIHGGGVWAPCIRYHNSEFYIYYPDPDRGIFMVKATKPEGPWSSPVMVKKGRGFIDPSPLWDDDGRAYMAYALAGSRAGVKSVLMVSSMNSEGTEVNDDEVLVFDGHDDNPTVEGPKFYKRNGYYYIFAPAGGVKYGWQLVLRSENIYGPYEYRTILKQGSTEINGPHQGAWITTKRGEDWFIHFQDKGAYGRVVHLQPLKWIDNWPVAGNDTDGDGVGEPVDTFRVPDVKAKSKQVQLQVNDEFNSKLTGLQWQWQANPSPLWGYPYPAMGAYRLNCIPKTSGFRNMWDVPNLFLQKFPAEEFTATASLGMEFRDSGEMGGMIVMGRNYQYIALVQTGDSCQLRVAGCADADKGTEEETIWSEMIANGRIFFRVNVSHDALCQFGYSRDGVEYFDAGEPFAAQPGMWIGAKIGFFALREGFTNDAGTMDIDWFRTQIKSRQ